MPGPLPEPTNPESRGFLRIRVAQAGYMWLAMARCMFMAASS
jgi:hypothetical protein